MSILINKKPKILVILGPTASGKTSLAVKLAKEFNGEIISADSRQVFRGMDIGTGKDLGEYGNIPYHLIDVVNPEDEFNLLKYQKLANKAIKDILSRGKLPIIAGGTGLYLQAIVDGGGTLIGAFLESELFQSFRVDIGTCIIGDQGLPLAKLKNIPTLSRAIKFKLIETEVFGDTVHLSYEPNNIESL